MNENEERQPTFEDVDEQETSGDTGINISEDDTSSEEDEASCMNRLEEEEEEGRWMVIKSFVGRKNKFSIAKLIEMNGEWIETLSLRKRRGKKNASHYYFPKKREISTIHPDQIVCYLKTPTKIEKSFFFSDDLSKFVIT